MSLYECVIIARQDLSSGQVESLTETLSTLVTEQGGEVKKKESWGLRSLAYKIKKNRKGHYVLLNLDAPAAAVAELERTMRLNEDVLRYLTIRVDELEEEPSVVLRSRGSRDRRFGRDRGDRGPRGDRGDRGDRGPRRDRPDSRPRDDQGGERQAASNEAASS